MTKWERLSICYGFAEGLSIKELVRFRWTRKEFSVIFSLEEVEQAVRWGLRDPDRVKKVCKLRRRKK